jgi:hypothetical protein
MGLLGGYRDNAADIREYQEQGAKANSAKAQEAAELIRDDILPLVRLRLSLRAIATTLNDAGILTPQSTNPNRKPWSAQGIKNVIARLAI